MTIEVSCSRSPAIVLVYEPKTVLERNGSGDWQQTHKKSTRPKIIYASNWHWVVIFRWVFCAYDFFSCFIPLWLELQFCAQPFRTSIAIEFSNNFKILFMHYVFRPPNWRRRWFSRINWTRTENSSGHRFAKQCSATAEAVAAIHTLHLLLFSGEWFSFGNCIDGPLVFNLFNVIVMI